MAVTFPFTSAIATEVLLLDHVTVRPESGVPFASFGVAVSWTDCPAATVADAGVTLTEATGTVQPETVTVAVSDRFPGLLVATTLDRPQRSEEHTSELQSRRDLVCRLLLEKK